MILKKRTVRCWRIMLLLMFEQTGLLDVGQSLTVDVRKKGDCLILKKRTV